MNSDFIFTIICFAIAFVIQLVSSIRQNIRTNDIEKFIKNTKFSPHLVNGQIQCFFKPIGTMAEIYVKEKPNGKKQGRLLTLIEQKNQAATIWAIIQKNFKNTATFDSILNSIGKYGVVIYTVKLEVIPEYEYRTYNSEFCRMEFTENILCKEIWPDINGKTRSCIIKGREEDLITVFTDFKNSPLENFDTVIKKYSQYEGITIEEREKQKEITKIDINNATLDEIKNLPIINIITAKKLIQKREELEGFKSVHDVCIFLRLSPTQELALSEMICLNPMKISPAKIKNKERNVDL